MSNFGALSSRLFYKVNMSNFGALSSWLFY